jgi:hypothetical protein
MQLVVGATNGWGNGWVGATNVCMVLEIVGLPMVGTMVWLGLRMANATNRRLQMIDATSGWGHKWLMLPVVGATNG